jgi:hypothetical protein
MRTPGRQFPIVPLGITVGLFAADGVLASSDVNNGRTRMLGGPTPAAGAHAPEWPRALMLQGAAVAAGLLGEFWANWPTDISDPLLFFGVGAAAREFAFRTAQGQGTATTPPVAAQAMRARALAAPRAAAFNSWGDRYPVGRVA